MQDEVIRQRILDILRSQVQSEGGYLGVGELVGDGRRRKRRTTRRKKASSSTFGNKVAKYMRMHGVSLPVAAKAVAAKRKTKKRSTKRKGRGELLGGFEWNFGAGPLGLVGGAKKKKSSKVKSISEADLILEQLRQSKNLENLTKEADYYEGLKQKLQGKADVGKYMTPEVLSKFKTPAEFARWMRMFSNQPKQLDSESEVMKRLYVDNLLSGATEKASLKALREAYLKE